MSNLKIWLGLWSSIAALALVAGCNLAPKYSPPPTPMPLAYKETNGWKIAEPSDSTIKGRWWEMFDDPRLNALEDQVAVSNQNIVAALETFLSARAVVKQARSEYYPTVSVDPSVTKSQTPFAKAGQKNTIQSGAGNSISSAYSLPLDASWEPDLWGSIRNTVAGASAAAQASAAQLENMRLTVQAELAVDYFQLRAQDELILLYQTTIKDYTDSLNLTKVLFDAGIDSDLDVAQADTLLETTLAQATALGIQRAQFEHAIALLVGRPASDFSIEPIPFNATNEPPIVPLGVPAQLLERRPDIAAAERTVASANAAIGVARAAYYPTLNLSGAAGFQSSMLSSLLNASSFYWTAGASLSETVFDAGRRSAVTDQAWATFQADAANYRETVLTAFQQVEDDLSSLRILATESTQQDVAIKAAQKNYDLALDRYRLGINSYLNVITAQVSLLSNRQTAVNIQGQRMTSSVQLIMALGGSWNASMMPTQKGVLTANLSTNQTTSTNLTVSTNK